MKKKTKKRSTAKKIKELEAKDAAQVRGGGKTSIKLDSIKGESIDTVHKDEIVVLSRY